MCSIFFGVVCDVCTTPFTHYTLPNHTLYTTHAPIWSYREVTRNNFLNWSSTVGGNSFVNGITTWISYVFGLKYHSPKVKSQIRIQNQNYNFFKHNKLGYWDPKLLDVSSTHACDKKINLQLDYSHPCTKLRETYPNIRPIKN